MRVLLFLFISIPILEMYILIQVGGMIGAIPTVALVVLTATRLKTPLWLQDPRPGRRSGLAARGFSGQACLG